MENKLTNIEEIEKTIKNVFAANTPLINTGDLINIISYSVSTITSDNVYKEIESFSEETKQLLNKCYLALIINNCMPDINLLEKAIFSMHDYKDLSKEEIVARKFNKSNINIPIVFVIILIIIKPSIVISFINNLKDS